MRSINYSFSIYNSQNRLYYVNGNKQRNRISANAINKDTTVHVDVIQTTQA